MAAVDQANGVRRSPAAVDDEVDAVDRLVFEQKRDAPTTSAIVTRRPIGVRCTSACRRSAGMSRHCGLSPTMAGCSALTRVGASSVTSVRTRLVTPPLTVVTVVEPG